MKLEKLVLRNFSSYFGDHELNLKTDEEKPVIIIIGSGGFGKTSLFQAINWSLYGEDYENDIKKYSGRKIVDFINESALGECSKTKEDVTMSATMYFSNDLDKYYITQTLTAIVKNENGKLNVQQEFRETKMYKIRTNGNHEEVPHYKQLLNYILPSNVRDYFFFDGDRIYKLASPGSSAEVRDAIYRVVDLELLKNAQDHLSDIAKEYARKAKQESTGELAEVESQYISLSDKKDCRLKEKKENDEEIRSVKTKLEVVNTKLRNLPDTREIQSKLDKLNHDITRLDEKLDDSTRKKREIAYQFSGSLVGETAEEIISLLNEKRAKGEIPRNVSKTYLEEMLRAKKCLICNEKIVPGNSLYKAVHARLEIEKKKKDDQVLLEYNFQLIGLSNIVSESRNDLNKIEIEINELEKQIKEKNLLKDQTKKELEKLPQEDIAGLVAESEKWMSEIEKKGRRDTEIQKELDQIIERIKFLEVQRVELAERQKNVKSLQTREKLALTASEEIASMYEKFAEESRVAVEQATVAEFKKFIKSSSEYNVSLNSSYELVITDSNGHRVLQRLSMGQSQCLSLAFITAISKVSEKYPPLVIDMPFGRLDETVHGDISKRLPELTKQLILFLLPNTEWNDQTKKSLQSKAKHIYNLEFDENKRRTKIKKIS